ncbi:hypothetical protein [Burkholderia stabilis]|uniref:hypothetical protein n=1 Tax=Burkholderia stabilis TaxID=95485 RepID=UPI000B13FF04|nr:fluoroacetate dehalogenase [Burkholderia stabilis]
MNRDVGAVVDREPDRIGFRQGFDQPHATSFEIRDLTIDGFEASPLDIGGLVARTSAFDQKHAVREAANVVNGETGRDHALDHPRRVTAYASLTVVPTLDAFARVDKTFALDAWHRFFLAQPADLPERTLAADQDAYIDAALAKMAGGIERIDPLALEAYRTAFRNPDVRHAICEDYRAATSEDLEHDASDFAAGRKLVCPMLVLWSEEEQKARNVSPVDTWSRWAENVTGGGLPGGHLLPEDAPNEVLASLDNFLIERL